MMHGSECDIQMRWTQGWNVTRGHRPSDILIEVLHIWMSHSLPCIICIVYVLFGHCLPLCVNHCCLWWQNLESLSFGCHGDEFISAHIDGSYAVWSLSDASRPKCEPVTPYGLFINVFLNQYSCCCFSLCRYLLFVRNWRRLLILFIIVYKLRHTHSHLTALFPGLSGWASTKKVKPIWISLKQETVSGSGISWAASLHLAPYW